jgi:hypothetical protein
LERQNADNIAGDVCKNDAVDGSKSWNPRSVVRLVRLLAFHVAEADGQLLPRPRPEVSVLPISVLLHGQHVQVVVVVLDFGGLVAREQLAAGRAAAATR